MKKQRIYHTINGIRFLGISGCIAVGKVMLCVISMALLCSGCQRVPGDVREKAENYQKIEDVEETGIRYVSLEHILDNQAEVLGKSYQNLEFPKTVHLQQPDSVSVLSLTVSNPFTTKEKFADLCTAFFGTAQYGKEIVRMENLPDWPDGQGVWGFNYNHPDEKDAAYVADSGYLVCHKENAKYIMDGRQAICHADWQEDLNTAYEIGGEEVSIREAVDYVNDWCNRYWSALEPDYHYQVKTVYVCGQNQDYYYAFDVCKFYKGMPFDDIDFSIDNPSGMEKDYYYETNMLYATMEHKNELSFLQNPGSTFDIKEEKIHNDKLIGLEQAVWLVQEKMSGGQKFCIRDIDLKYVIRSDLDEDEAAKKGFAMVSPGLSYTARPVWSFILDYQPTKEEQESYNWSRKFINVDMITGEILYLDHLV